MFALGSDHTHTTRGVLMDITDKKEIQWFGTVSATFKCSCGKRVTVNTKRTVTCSCGNRFWLDPRLFVEVHHRKPRIGD
jgi:hypothetical protein